MNCGYAIQLIRCLITLGLVALSPSIAADDDYLSIKFSKKNQLRTGMVWIQFKPKLVLAQTQRKKQKNWYHKVSGNDQQPKRVYTSSNGGKPASMPQAAVGKLFYTKSDGQIANCSAAFAGGRDVIVTAAHCVMSDSGDWHGDFLFIRSYGSEEHDVFAIDCIATPGEWGEQTGDILDYDYAFLRTSRITPSGNLRITDQNPPDNLRLLGYSDRHNDGRQMLDLNVQVVTAGAGRLGSMGNHMGAGSSGSPWLASSTVYSVSSYYNIDEKDLMWGPRLSKNTLELAAYTQNGCESNDPI